MICREYFISGRVQGVFFRANTKTTAQTLKLTGYVENLADGRVHVVACGTEATLISFANWLQHGPTLAQVQEVKTQEMAWEFHEQFVIR